MSADTALDDLAAAFGVVPVYADLSGTERKTSRETTLALLRANGLDLANDAMIAAALAEHQRSENVRVHPRELIVDTRHGIDVPTSESTEWWLALEGGEGLTKAGRASGTISLPPLPTGIHHLHVASNGVSETVRLIVAPAGLPNVQTTTGQQKIWGVTAALFGLRSDRNLGIGDFEDLAVLAEQLADKGAGFVGINPVHSWGWASPEIISPYSPSHRGFLNSAHIAIDKIPGLAGDPDAERIIGRAQKDAVPARCAEFVQYRDLAKIQRVHLRDLYEVFRAGSAPSAKAEFEAFKRQGGDDLIRYAQFEVLSESLGADWREWPLAAQNPSGLAGLRDWTGDQSNADFHKWLQWVSDRQLGMAGQRARSAGMSAGLYLDLAVGSRRGGAETWCYSESVAAGVSIGAPPDQLSPEGQKWDLAAFSPSLLAQHDYQGFRDILRSNMKHAGILRIDHVLGLNRCYWIPDDGSPGGYIRQPFEALMAIVAIEAARSNTIVVGEDLGLVPEGFRDTMSRRGFYGYSVLQYEKDGAGRYHRPEDLRPDSLACFGTHDTPTLKGFWAGRDIDWWTCLGWVDDAESSASRARREAEKSALYSLQDNETGDAAAAPFAEVSQRVHKLVAEASSAMACVQFDDAIGEIESQNLPGTIDEHPNWCRRCPVMVEDIGANENVVSVARIMDEAGRSQE